MARKRKKGKREPNGRISRRKGDVSVRLREAERAAISVALDTRKRMYGLSEQDARDPHAGTVLGRMRLEGRISADQIQAADRYIEVVSAYQRAIGARPAHDEPRPEGDSAESYEAFCKRAKAVYEAMQTALRELMIEERSPAPLSALDVIVIRDCWSPNLDGALRSALNCLYRHFFTTPKRAAA